MKDFYRILEVDRKASIDVIEKAYKVLAKKYHPDLQTTQEAKKIAEEKIKTINEAYEILKDEEKRRKYDLQLEREEAKYSQNYSKESTINNSKVRNASPKNTNYATYNNVMNNQNNYNVGSNLTEKEIKKMNKKLQRKMEEEYLKAYGDYLTKNGYKVAFRMNWRKLPYLLLVILILIVIGAILWFVPATHSYLVSMYENNIIIRKLVNVIVSLFHK